MTATKKTTADCWKRLSELSDAFYDVPCSAGNYDEIDAIALALHQTRQALINDNDCAVAQASIYLHRAEALIKKAEKNA